MAASRSGKIVLAALLAAAIVPIGVPAQERPAGAGASVPIPPPEPPPRPDELKAPVVPPPNPIADAPLPPQRPGELADAPAKTPPSDAPQPPARPPELSAVSALPPTIRPAEAPLPPERPHELIETPPGTIADAPLPPSRPSEMASSPALDVPEDAACLRSLDALGVKYEKLPPIVNGQCSVAHPLDLKSIGDGVAMESIAVTADQMIVCSVAEGLGRWAKDVQAAAEKELGDRLKGLTLGGGYHCRGQNNVGEGKLSEHAFANAMDIMGFTFTKRAPLLVAFQAEGSAEAKFLASARASACRYFRTVLGPGSNESHANHFHFDQRRREGDHRICELEPPAPPAPAAAATHSADVKR